MTYVLNIGLNNLPDNFSRDVHQQVSAVINAIAGAGFKATLTRIVQSDTEPTLVVHAETRYSYVPAAVRIEGLASALNQDCVAAVFPSGSGALLGPRAEAWGAFNPDMFFCIDGTRLSQHVRSAA